MLSLFILLTILTCLIAFPLPHSSNKPKEAQAKASELRHKRLVVTSKPDENRQPSPTLRPNRYKKIPKPKKEAIGSETISKKKLKLSAYYPCDRYDEQSKECIYVRALGTTLTVGVEAKGDESITVQWFRFFKKNEASKPIYKELLSRDALPWNINLGGDSTELRISPITETDFSYNFFLASLGDSSLQNHQYIKFIIEPIDVDMGPVYRGEEITISVRSFIELPKKSISFEWSTIFFRNNGFVTGNLPSNMRVTRDRSGVVIKEHRSYEDMTLTCAMYSNKGFFVARRNFLLRRVILNKPDIQFRSRPTPYRRTKKSLNELEGDKESYFQNIFVPQTPYPQPTDDIDAVARFHHGKNAFSNLLNPGNRNIYEDPKQEGKEFSNLHDNGRELQRSLMDSFPENQIQEHHLIRQIPKRNFKAHKRLRSPIQKKTDWRNNYSVSVQKQRSNLKKHDRLFTPEQRKTKVYYRQQKPKLKSTKPYYLLSDDMTGYRDNFSDDLVSAERGDESDYGSSDNQYPLNRRKRSLGGMEEHHEGETYQNISVPRPVEPNVVENLDFHNIPYLLLIPSDDIGDGFIISDQALTEMPKILDNSQQQQLKAVTNSQILNGQINESTKQPVEELTAKETVSGTAVTKQIKNKMQYLFEDRDLVPNRNMVSSTQKETFLGEYVQFVLEHETYDNLQNALVHPLFEPHPRSENLDYVNKQRRDTTYSDINSQYSKMHAYFSSFQNQNLQIRIPNAGKSRKDMDNYSNPNVTKRKLEEIRYFVEDEIHKDAHSVIIAGHESSDRNEQSFNHLYAMFKLWLEILRENRRNATLEDKNSETGEDVSNIATGNTNNTELQGFNFDTTAGTLLHLKGRNTGVLGEYFNSGNVKRKSLQEEYLNNKFGSILPEATQHRRQPSIPSIRQVYPSRQMIQRRKGSLLRTSLESFYKQFLRVNSFPNLDNQIDESKIKDLNALTKSDERTDDSLPMKKNSQENRYSPTSEKQYFDSHIRQKTHSSVRKRRSLDQFRNRTEEQHIDSQIMLKTLSSIRKRSLDQFYAYPRSRLSSRRKKSVVESEVRDNDPNPNDGENSQRLTFSDADEYGSQKLDFVPKGSQKLGRTLLDLPTPTDTFNEIEMSLAYEATPMSIASDQRELAMNFYNMPGRQEDNSAASDDFHQQDKRAANLNKLIEEANTIAEMANEESKLKKVKVISDDRLTFGDRESLTIHSCNDDFDCGINAACFQISTGDTFCKCKPHYRGNGVFCWLL